MRTVLLLAWLSAANAFLAKSSVAVTTFQNNKVPKILTSIRGGDTALNAGADFSDAAQALFGNMISPASMLAGKLFLESTIPVLDSACRTGSLPDM